MSTLRTEKHNFFVYLRSRVRVDESRGVRHEVGWSPSPREEAEAKSGGGSTVPIRPWWPSCRGICSMGRRKGVRCGGKEEKAGCPECGAGNEDVVQIAGGWERNNNPLAHCTPNKAKSPHT
ncbi:hypothetical protein B0H16DRAFT_1462990 [Mycena metata]|uniref:Uncharacterized protein n=1 Tax=Mycena metata TaxID=1033252 RepID=A0AAD7IJV8_9AGAR|nr:hypothetical protein B0H16DRAFT_1462990 [Mycena metata]